MNSVYLTMTKYLIYLEVYNYVKVDGIITMPSHFRNRI